MVQLTMPIIFLGTLMGVVISSYVTELQVIILLSIILSYMGLSAISKF